MKAHESDAWMKEGTCRDMPPEVFFSYDAYYKEVALLACGSCAVREVCLEYALEHRIDHGIWGGTTEEQRRKIRKAQREAAQGAA